MERNTYQKKWRQDNLKKVREQAMGYVERQIANNEQEYRKRVRENARNYYHRHKEEVRKKDNERKRIYRLTKRDKYNEKQREYRRLHPEKFKKYQEKRKEWSKEYSRIKTIEKYGLTEESYNQMLLSQKGKCAICDGDFKHQKNIDHNHMTGEVRGILCSYCNTTLGYIERAIERQTDVFERIMKYLKIQSKKL